MSSDPVEASEVEARFIALVTEYLTAQGAGLAPDRPTLLAAHPDLAGELAEFFAAEDRSAGLAALLRTVAQAATLPSDRPASPPDPLLIDALDTLGFDVLEEINRGGVGVIYKARQRTPNRVVAIKTIGVDRQVSAQDLQRFRNEAETLATLRHENIVTIHLVAEHKGRLFLCM